MALKTKEKTKEKLIDSLDTELIQLLGEDGRIPIKDIAENLGITSPTVHSRLKNLIKSGVLKIAGLVNTFKMGNIITALIAIQVDDDSKLDEKIEKLAELKNVNFAYAVTGRYDIFTEVILTKGMSELFDFMSVELPSIGGIKGAESFVVMKASRRWTMLPLKLEAPE